MEAHRMSVMDATPQQRGGGEVGLGTHHCQLVILVHYHGPDEGCHDAARQGVVGVNDGTGLGIA